MANVITNAAKAIFTNLVGGLGGTAPNYMAIGSGAGTAAVTDTTLFTEYTTGTWTSYARANVTPTRATVTTTNDQLQWVGTFTAGAAQTVTNGGLFDASTAGNMAIKGDWPGVPLALGDSLQLTVKLQFT